MRLDPGLGQVVPASELPTGTLTFLFTDVEGSTRLWEQQREAMREALIRHDRLIEHAVADHAGVLVRPRGEGDSRFAVFSQPSSAVAAACQIQFALQVATWPISEPLRVRIALHTGEADLRDGDYYGPAVNRCARLRGLAAGGQVLVSGTTAALVQDLLAPGTALRALGTFALKDLSQMEQIYQLLHPDLPDRFPGPQSRPTGTLPSQPTTLIGRGTELGELRHAVRRPGVKQLTIVGPGGVGKTRLALAVAESVQSLFEHGAWFVDLSHIGEPGLVPATIARVLQVRERAGTSSLAQLYEHIRERQLLLVLDNCEQVLEAATDIAELLGACPGLKVLATSREPLRIRWEHVFPVPLLELPDLAKLPSAKALARVPAVAVFVHYARAAQPAFELNEGNAKPVAELVGGLDGLPLAIELAAARVRTLPPDLLGARIKPLLDTLTGARDAPDRHRSLRAVTAWSYDLLTRDEQSMFRRLAIFPGGCSLEAAEAIVGQVGQRAVLDGLMSLVDKNLLRADVQPHQEPRYLMLETIRAFAHEQLASTDDHDALAQRHVEYFVALGERAESELRGAAQFVWINRLDQEQVNIRSALRWADEHAQHQLVLRLGSALWYYCHVRGLAVEGRAWLERALAASRDAPAALLAKALNAVGALAAGAGDATAVEPNFKKALELRRQLGDRAGVGSSLNSLGVLHMTRGNYKTAGRYFDRALVLHRTGREEWRVALVLGNLGWLAQAQGEYGRATQLHQESLALWRELNNIEGAAASLEWQAWIARCTGDRTRAHELVAEALNLAREVGSTHVVGRGLYTVGMLHADAGDAGAAAAALQQSIELLRGRGEEQSVLDPVEGSADIALLVGRSDRAVRIVAAVDGIRRTRRWPRHHAQRTDRERRIVAARAALGQTEFDACWAEGARLSPGRALAWVMDRALDDSNELFH